MENSKMKPKIQKTWIFYGIWYIILEFLPESHTEIIQLNNGIFFREIRSAPTFYSQTIPIMFEEKLPLTKMKYWYEIMKIFPVSNGTVYSNDATTIIRNLFEQEWLSVTNLSPELNHNSRKKRAIIPFIGDFYRWCFGTALLSDIAPLNTNVENIAAHYAILKKTIIDDHKHLLEFNVALKNTSTNLFDGFATITEYITNVEAQSNMHKLIQTKLLLYLLHFQQITQKCHLKFLPPNAVSRSLLASTLEKLSQSARRHNLQLAIPISELRKYYSLPLTTCQLNNDTVTYTLRVPLHSSDQNYIIYDMIPIAFKNDNELCQLRIEKSLLITHSKNNELHVLSGYTLENCRPQDKLCKLGHALWDRNYACITALFRKSSVETLNKYCTFTCTTDIPDEFSLPKIFPVDAREFIISNPSFNTLLRYPNESLIKLHDPLPENGASYVRLPCDVQLIEKKENKIITLIDKLVPCIEHELLQEKLITRILPAQWMKYPSLETFHGINTLHSHDSSLKLFNKNWKLSIPTTQIRTVAEIEDELRNLTLIDHKNTLYGNRFITDIIFTGLFILIFLLIGFQYYVTYIRSASLTLADFLANNN